TRRRGRTWPPAGPRNWPRGSRGGEPMRKYIRRLLQVLVVLNIGAIASVGYLWWQAPQAALRAHLHGVGHMERYEYEPARQAFEKALKRRPGWQTAKINLAIALLNLGANNAAALARARAILGEVLADDPENVNAHYSL